MKRLSVIFLVLSIGVSTSAALARGGGHGGMGTHHASLTGQAVTGGAFGTSPSAPGTNSLGTALSSNGVGNGPQKGPLLGTDPAIDREEAKVDQSIRSICRGC
jgi:hypothetical protein